MSDKPPGLSGDHFKTAASGEDAARRIKVAAFLNSCNSEWPYTGDIARINPKRDHVAIPLPRGFDIIGYQIIEVDEKRLKAADDILGDFVNPVEILQKGQRYFYTDDQTALLGGDGRPRIGDIKVDHHGRFKEEIKPAEIITFKR